MTGGRRRRADEALESVTAGLWPVGARRLSWRPGRDATLLVLPGARRPRILVPSDVPAAASMLRRHSRSPVQRLAQDVLAWAHRHQLLALLPWPRWRAPQDGEAGIDGLVRTVVPDARRVGVLLGPPRANAKPVLQVFDERGMTIAFGKVGNDERTRSLVRRETRALTDLSDPGFATLQVPRILWSGEWEGLQVVLLSPMSASQDRASSWEVPAAAMRELAEAEGVVTQALRDDAYVTDLMVRADRLLATEPEIVASLATLGGQVGDLALRFGRWHGDWAPWNMGVASGRVQVWDWERSRRGVPLGFDLVHFLLQRHLKDGHDAGTIGESILTEVGDLLAPWYGPEQLDRSQTAATVLLYLLEIQCRYRADAGASPGVRLHARLNVIAPLTMSVAAAVEGAVRADA